jgi:hypothetical protein
MFTEERARWLYQHYRWLEANLPARVGEHAPQLILPTPEFFPARNTRDHAFAKAMFDTTRSFMGVIEWQCDLVAQSGEEREQQVAMTRGSGLYGESKFNDAAGTFSAGDRVQITYSPRLLGEPVGLVATLAHELCHYLLAMVKVEPPCGWSEHEPLTDLAAVHEGFGVFLCNSAFNFNQWTDSQYSGWQSSTRGYLNEAELGFSLALFCVLNGVEPELGARHLKPNPAEVFWDSLDYIADLARET